MATAGTCSTLNGLFKAVYADKIKDLIPEFTVLVHPDTYKQLMEDSMAYESNQGLCVPTQESPIVEALRHHKYRIKNLRDQIARAQEELRIELALLAAVKKLEKKGGK